MNYLPPAILIFAFIGCSLVDTDEPDRISVFPRDTNPQVRTFVEREFLQIIVVTESPEWRPTVTLEHIGRGWVGVTYGAWDIRIETSLVEQAMTNEAALWALRRTIATKSVMRCLVIGSQQQPGNKETSWKPMRKELSTLSDLVGLVSFGLIILPGV